jgi:hypothetical protein
LLDTSLIEHDDSVLIGRGDGVLTGRENRPVYPSPPPHGSCRGSLIQHLDGTPAGCTEVEDGHDCAGIDLRHESDPTTCVVEWGGCNYCGVHP